MNMAKLSSNLIPQFPNEITENILVRLPVKSLVRLSCVSKSWYHLVFSNQEESSSFARFYLQYPTREPPRRVWLKNYENHVRSLTLCNCSNKIPDLDGREFAKGEKSFFCLGKLAMTVVSCVDGVFCLLQNLHPEEPRICLWNPGLRQSISLPCSSMDFGFVTLAVGFGYDDTSQDYKVVKFQFVKRPSKGNLAANKFDVYSLKTHSWISSVGGAPNYVLNPFDPGLHSLVEAFDRSIPPFNLPCVILNGYMYWNAGRVHLPYVHYVHLTGENDSGHFAIPDYVMAKGCSRLRLYKGCLSLSGFTGLNDFELWVMKGDNSSNVWVKQFSISNSLGFSPLYSVTDVTAGGMIVGYINQQIGRKAGLAVYDPESEAVEFVTDKSCIFCDYFLVDNYVESLVSVVPSSGEKKFDVPKSKSLAQVLFCCFCESMN